MAQASWFACSSCFFLRAMLPPALAFRLVVEIALELGLDVARVLALRDGDEPLYDHGAHLHLAVNHRLELVAHRQEQEVRKGNAVNGGHEGGRDAVTELGGIVEILHHRHESHDGADDAERWGVN